MAEVVLRKKAQKELANVPHKYYKRIVDALLTLEEMPHSGKPLAGPLEGYRSIRVWPYRVIYAYLVDQDQVYVIRIGHRRGVYGVN